MTHLDFHMLHVRSIRNLSKHTIYTIFIRSIRNIINANVMKMKHLDFSSNAKAVHIYIYIYMLRKSTVLFIQPKAFNLQQWTVLVCVPIVYTSRRKKFCSVECPNHSDRSIFLPKASTNLCKSFVTSASLPSSSSAVLRTRSLCSWRSCCMSLI